MAEPEVGIFVPGYTTRHTLRDATKRSLRSGLVEYEDTKQLLGLHKTCD